MFDSNASASQMASTVYAEHMNCGYSHSLDDDGLRATIDSLLSRNLIQAIGSSVNTTEPRFSLTESGGEIWELERQPDWQRYVTTSQRELGNFPTGSIVAFCADQHIGRRCLGAMFASGLITPAGPIRTREIYNKRLLPWKSFSSGYALQCRTSDNVNQWPKPIEWDVYESSRCWWQTVSELQALHR